MISGTHSYFPQYKAGCLMQATSLMQASKHIVVSGEMRRRNHAWMMDGYRELKSRSST